MASATGSDAPPIVLYHYPYSPYARRVAWYLSLRGIPYAECVSPPSPGRQHVLTRRGPNRSSPPLCRARTSHPWASTTAAYPF